MLSSCFDLTSGQLVPKSDQGACLDAQELPLSAYTQTPFRKAAPAPGGGCCPPGRWPPHFGPEKQQRQEPFPALPLPPRMPAGARRYANIFLDRLYKKGNCSDEELIELAFSVHKEAGPDAIEFIICTADDEDRLTITCIKDGTVHYNCSVAWLGDKNVFERLQQLRLLDEEKNIFAAFKLAIEKSQQPEKEDGRFSVGGFIVQVMYRFSEHRFIYPFHFESHHEREQIVQPGEAIQFFAPAEEGGYTATCRDSTKDFIIDLEQPSMTIAYTDRYRYAEPESINSSTNHLMLPLLIQTDSGNVLP